MDSGASIYLGDSHKGFAGLKSVLSTNKKRHEAMPKSVSDMFVATRSTQSLDELRNDDVLQYAMKWSNGDDHLSEVNGITSETLDASSRGSLPNSHTTNSISFSMAASTTSSAQNAAGNRHSFTSVESDAQDVDVNITTQSSSSNDAEFCRNINSSYSFPNDDSDETIIPFEHISVSKFGPISRMSKVKMYNSAPVQVTADSYKWMTPVLSVTPLDRPVATSMQMPTRYPCGRAAEFLNTEPSVKPTPSEIPSIWQHTPQPSYHNIARMKAGAAEAVTNNERLAYELQAVELEIAMKTGKEPEPFRKIIQDAVMASSQASQAVYRPSSDLVTSRGSSFATMMSQGHAPDHLRNMEAREILVSSHQAAQHYIYRSLQGTKK